jgi:hypothetical protein
MTKLSASCLVLICAISLIPMRAADADTRRELDYRQVFGIGIVAMIGGIASLVAIETAILYFNPPEKRPEQKQAVRQGAAARTAPKAEPTKGTVVRGSSRLFEVAKSAARPGTQPASRRLAPAGQRTGFAAVSPRRAAPRGR